MSNNEEHIVRYSAEELAEMRRRGEDKTDWARVDAMTDEELEASIDVEEEGEIDWDNVEAISNIVHIQPDILVWFREQGPGYQEHLNQVLRSYVDAQRNKQAS